MFKMDYLSEQLKKCYLEHNTSDYCKDIILFFDEYIRQR